MAKTKKIPPFLLELILYMKLINRLGSSYLGILKISIHFN